MTFLLDASATLDTTSRREAFSRHSAPTATRFLRSLHTASSIGVAGIFDCESYSYSLTIYTLKNSKFRVGRRTDAANHMLRLNSHICSCITRNRSWESAGTVLADYQTHNSWSFTTSDAFTKFNAGRRTRNCWSTNEHEAPAELKTLTCDPQSIVFQNWLRRLTASSVVCSLLEVRPLTYSRDG